MYGLDLFSGVGGITKALDGYVRPVAYCEIDRYARGVLLSRMATGDLPVAPIWDDVTTLRGSMLPRVDIIYGGFPCQDISVAGKQVGLGGERSGLFFEIVRLASEIRPSFIFLENVPNIRTKGLGLVLQTLADNGYDCRWGSLPASDVGAPHKRERWFLLANTTGEQNRRLCESGLQSDIGTSGKVADPECFRRTKMESRNTSGTETEGPTNTPSDSSIAGRHTGWNIEPNVGRVANGVPKRVDRLKALGNAVVPAQVKEAFERLMGIK